VPGGGRGSVMVQEGGGGLKKSMPHAFRAYKSPYFC